MSKPGMVMKRYRYVLEISNQDGTVLGQVPVEPDFEPALEWTRFQHLRQISLAEIPMTPPGRPVIEPVWDAGRGAPFLSGFRGVIPESSGQPVSCEFPTTYLSLAARRASAGFVDKGLLKAGDIFRYKVFALRVTGAEATADRGTKIAVDEIKRPLPLTERSMQPLLEESIERREPVGDDLPVFIPQRVLDGATELARRAVEVEVGGVLVGELCRDPANGALFVEITAQITARHTVANTTKLTFTPDTWADIDAVLELRSRDEIKVSWWHYHPNFCRKCPPAARARCTFSSEFFSAEDVHLHRTCFGSAFNVAFLVSDLANRGLVWSCFGWRHGMVTSRGYHITGANPEKRRSAVAEPISAYRPEADNELFSEQEKANATE